MHDEWQTMLTCRDVISPLVSHMRAAGLLPPTSRAGRLTSRVNSREIRTRIYETQMTGKLAG